MKSHWIAGQFNLRGKKSKSLRCGCCEVEDYRDAYRIKQAEREVRLAKEIFDTVDEQLIRRING